ncbi:type I-E CRISPR-associated protein Cse1/CasA [Pseudoalteromonas piscicida]|uniref:type I-E CRISPR-associated protein Cse1/CasA n=1 Tax=Pseudoalteromonas piscicida TaxID=43662 RepID=UPI001C93F7F9|nr:type I-E CRISPR-associated protein Cse1/CasA [Pseudoalteromonas piscicida]QZO15292.1 type I-E CRISPR-associated protein Cse1/CasA [Pseudoalteromonas piscicida]
MNNLVQDPWLYYRLRDNSITQLPLSAIANPDVVDFALPRADFYGAAYQFTIGLLQTCCSPGEGENWYNWYESSPSEQALSELFSKAAHAFNLFGDGPLFMQDLDPLQSAGTQNVNTLLIETPGDNTLKNNVDHFIKRGQVEAMSPEMAALALFTLQINAPSGGQGYRTGLRGGGPLTTLLLPNEESASLWHKLWLNVCIEPQVSDVELQSGTIFPWLTDTKVSKEKGTEVLFKDAHFLTHFWAMPRRIRLQPEESLGTCSLTGHECDVLVKSFATTNYGNNYAGSWWHPLTHYRSDPKKPNEDNLSSKGQPGGIQYKQWHALCFANESEGNHPAKVIQEFYDIKKEYLEQQPRLWAFGFDMDNMKARGWYDSQFPVFLLGESNRANVIHDLNQALQIAMEFSSMMRTLIKEALFDRPKDVKADLAQHTLSYWQRSERDFFIAAQAICVEGELRSEDAKRWFYRALNTALDIFDEVVLSTSMDNKAIARKVAARQKLTAWLHGKKISKDFKRRYNLKTQDKEAQANDA